MSSQPVGIFDRFAKKAVERLQGIYQRLFTKYYGNRTAVEMIFSRIKVSPRPNCIFRISESPLLRIAKFAWNYAERNKVFGVRMARYRHMFLCLVSSILRLYKLVLCF